MIVRFDKLQLLSVSACVSVDVCDSVMCVCICFIGVGKGLCVPVERLLK